MLILSGFRNNIFNVTCYHIVGCSVDLMPSFFEKFREIALKVL